MKGAIFAFQKLEYLRQLTTILFLLSFLVFTLPFNTSKTIAKQFTSSIPAEEEDSSSKIPDVNEYDSKIVQTIKQIHFSSDIFYILTKERFTHYIHHVFPVDWLETFSPPPDAA